MGIAAREVKVQEDPSMGWEGRSVSLHPEQLPQYWDPLLSSVLTEVLLDIKPSYYPFRFLQMWLSLHSMARWVVLERTGSIQLE